MTPPSQAEAEFRPRQALAVTAGFFTLGLAISALYATTGLGIPCPFRALTGWECPLCGGTRLGSALLHADLITAFAANPVLLIGLAVLGGLGISWAVASLGGPHLRLPRSVVQRLRGVPTLVWLAAAMGLAAAYTMLRNLL
ncbi:MAG TPA: DUF2752 domain-containing protein [Propionibacteriaceae bacterium]